MEKTSSVGWLERIWIGKMLEMDLIANPKFNPRPNHVVMVGALLIQFSNSLGLTKKSTNPLDQEKTHNYLRQHLKITNPKNQKRKSSNYHKNI